MKTEPLVFLGTCDLAGLVRGKGFPVADLPSRMRVGVGLSHSNIMMSAFGPIYETPFGTEGELMLVPDPSTKVEVEFGDAHRALLSRRHHDHRRASPGNAARAQFLRRAVAALNEAGRPRG